MFDYLLSYYFNNHQNYFVPLSVKIITPGDFHLYLFVYGSEWYVFVESDFPLLKSLSQDILANFPVDIIGWHVLKEKQKEALTDTLPPNCFSSDSANETDENWQHYHWLFHQANGMKYALLQVTPKTGIDIGFYRQ